MSQRKRTRSESWFGEKVNPESHDGKLNTRKWTKSEGHSDEVFDFLPYDEKIFSISLKLQMDCSNNGTEIDPKKSANLFYLLGKAHFKHSVGNKISLLRSVGLLNSALARKPVNASNIEKELKEICRHVLQLANACSMNADLISKADDVKLNMIKSMRKIAKEMLDKVKVEHHHTKVKLIKEIQLRISEQYTQIMQNISQYCENVMGSPPCKFAIASMGSLARKEITPYSDFEHIILLENQENYTNHLEYFRWYSVIFHIIILNLQETIIPSLHIKYLNDATASLGDWFFDAYSTNGVSFDGMMPHACKFPLGRTQHTKNKPFTAELIKSVDGMLEYLSSEAELKNGYHLSDILMKTYFVYDDRSTYEEFANGIQSYKTSKTRDEVVSDIRLQVKEDLDKFATRIRLAKLKPNQSINIKQLFYRSSTLFIAAMGKIWGTTKSSSFDVIEELREKDIITENTRDKLMLAVAIACEIRLRIYTEENSQRDYIDLDKILEIVEGDSLISYFQITYCLQLEVTYLLGIKGFHIYSNPTFLNITISNALRHDDLMLFLLQKYEKLNSSGITASMLFKEQINDESEQVRLDHFDEFLSYLENEIRMFGAKIRKQFSSNGESVLSSQSCCYEIFKSLASIGNSLYDTNRIDEALEFWKNCGEILTVSTYSNKQRERIEKFVRIETPAMIANVKIGIASCLADLKQYDEALVEINKVFESFSVLEYRSHTIFELYFLAGNVWFKLKNYNQSLACFQLSLAFGLDLSYDNVQKLESFYVMSLYTGIGCCLLHLHKYKESQTYLNLARHMSYKKPNENDYHFYYLVFRRPAIFQNLAKCAVKLEQYENVLPFLNEALEQATEDKSDIELLRPVRKSYNAKRKAEDLASVLFDLGFWLMLNHTCSAKAVEKFERLLKIQEFLSETETVASTQN